MRMRSDPYFQNSSFTKQNDLLSIKKSTAFSAPCFCFVSLRPSSPLKTEKHPVGCFFLVQLMGLEPIRLPTRPSNVRVCQFRHSCILSCLRLFEEGFPKRARLIIHEYSYLSIPFLQKKKKTKYRKIPCHHRAIFWAWELI